MKLEPKKTARLIMAPVVLFNCHFEKVGSNILAPNVWLKNRQLAKNAESLVLFIGAGWKEFSL